MKNKGSGESLKINLFKKTHINHTFFGFLWFWLEKMKKDKERLEKISEDKERKDKKQGKQDEKAKEEKWGKLEGNDWKLN